MRRRFPHSFHHRHAFSTAADPVRQPPRTFTHLLQLCLQKCKQLSTHKLFGEMPHRLSHASNTAKLIHSQALKLGFSSNGQLGNSIIDLYAKCGNVDFAEKAFNSLETKDVLAWNSILSAYSKQGSLGLVTESFGLLWNGGVLPNKFTLALVASACARLGSFHSGTQVHCIALKLGFASSSYFAGALIDMYAKCNLVGDARRVFDTVVDLDTVSWTAMISGYVHVGLAEEALTMFEEMQKVGLQPDQITFATVINAYVGLGRLDDASALFFQMPSPNVVAWNMMISAHTKRGFEAEAVQFFHNMRKVGVKSTRSTLGSVLSAVGSLAALNYGLIVHAEATKQGLDSNVYVGSSLISMYAKCGKIEEARKVFDALDERNIVLWNSVLGAYAQNGYAYEAVNLFFNMNISGLHPDDFSYSSILSACACLKYLELGRQLHSLIIKNKWASNLFVGNALVDMYAKSGALEDARQQFDRIGNKDNVSWNAIIVGYVQEEDELEAFHLFQKMNMLGILPDEVSLASILSACANLKGLKEGKQLHCLSVKLGLETRLYAGSSLVDMYVKCEVIESAHKMLDSMPERTVASMNSLIAGYAQTSLEIAVTLFKQMQIEGLNSSEITYAGLLDACDGPANLNFGMQIHCHILKKGLQFDDEFLGVSLLGMYLSSHRKRDASILFSEFSYPKSAVLWTAMISGLTQNDCSLEALQLYKEMRSHNVLPDQATFVSTLRACSILSSMRNGREIHSLIFHTGLHLDELTCSALVDMYAKCGDVKSSQQVFEEMGAKVDVISWNSMIVGYAKNGYAEDAIRVFHEMKHAHVLPDDITFLGVLSACSHAGKVYEGREIFDIMINCYRMEPRSDHCACMIDLLGRWGFLKEAEEFIDKLNFVPDAKIWATMLGACRIHGDDIRGQRAAEKLIELEPQNSSAYVLLSNIHAASENWEEAKSLRERMREKGVKKLPGCSWILVGRKTNLFVSGDKSHPNAAEIDEVLMDLELTVHGCSLLLEEAKPSAESILLTIGQCQLADRIKVLRVLVTASSQGFNLAAWRLGFICALVIFRVIMPTEGGGMYKIQKMGQIGETSLKFRSDHFQIQRSGATLLQCV
ncbi:hypothetical protein Tsubulata_010201 [Turnera subulata]|uniref:DYW domain-containing protein n=1 Tax=Turnera subulata TaxID=218843 RepID=A0A9Q0FHZ7_9ROSI|nr:hypothetical protein Tsubulata_010201 [Turnera subulata]